MTPRTTKTTDQDERREQDVECAKHFASITRQNQVKTGVAQRRRQLQGRRQFKRIPARPLAHQRVSRPVLQPAASGPGAGRQQLRQGNTQHDATLDVASEAVANRQAHQQSGALSALAENLRPGLAAFQHPAEPAVLAEVGQIFERAGDRSPPIVGDGQVSPRHGQALVAQQRIEIGFTTAGIGQGVGSHGIGRQRFGQTEHSGETQFDLAPLEQGIHREQGLGVLNQQLARHQI